MKGVNSHWEQLTAEEISAGKHREVVGGMWELIGRMQCDYLKLRGLQPHHSLLDVGCGSLRGGIHFIDYLNADQYCGLDVNESLIEAAKIELTAANLWDKKPRLIVNDQFQFSQFKQSFDYAVAISVFTHLFMNHIARCLWEVRQVLKPDGKFYATFFQAPHAVHLENLTHQPGGITTHYDSDPFHYAPEELSRLAESAGMSAEYIGDWQHPRSQKMFCFRRK